MPTRWQLPPLPRQDGQREVPAGPAPASAQTRRTPTLPPLLLGGSRQQSLGEGPAARLPRFPHPGRPMVPSLRLLLTQSPGGPVGTRARAGPGLSHASRVQTLRSSANQ